MGLGAQQVSDSNRTERPGVESPDVELEDRDQSNSDTSGFP
jgi:hypothetical protein